jgi:hypothetical protein
MLNPLLALAFALSHLAEPAPPPLVDHIAGCFAVSYRFVEDGDHDYEIPRVLEWITVKPAGHVSVVQHYGIYEDKAHPGTFEVMKHFREDWSSPDGVTWTQKVFGPGGDFRYACTSPDRFGQLRCKSPGAPKPVRDAERDDYDVLDRDTTLQITPRGWVQSEVNDKVKTDGTVVATEVGWVEYRRIDEAACAPARQDHPGG